MARNLGIRSSSEYPYHFISYSSEEQARVSEYARMIDRYGISLWYDDGIEVGDEWENTISERMKESDAVVMFLTRSIFDKADSYVYKEFKMATKFFKKKVVVVLLDEIKEEEVPAKYVPWWIDVTSMQSIEAYRCEDIPACAEQIAKALGYDTAEVDKTERIRRDFRLFGEDEKLGRMDGYVNKLMKTHALETRARMILDAVDTGLVCHDKDGKETRTRVTTSPYIHIGEHCFHSTMRTISMNWIFTHDALEIFKDDEKVYSMSGMFDIYYDAMVYDEMSDILYIVYTALVPSQAIPDSHDDGYVPPFCRNVLVVENPCGTLTCTNFVDLRPAKELPWR